MYNRTKIKTKQELTKSKKILIHKLLEKGKDKLDYNRSVLNWDRTYYLEGKTKKEALQKILNYSKLNKIDRIEESDKRWINAWIFTESYGTKEIDTVEKMCKNEKQNFYNIKEREYNGIKFKSKLEEIFYRKAYSLKEEGLIDEVNYEPIPFILQENFVSTNLIVFESKKRASSLIRKITYTPDFILKKGDMTIIVETKGFETDSFKLKKKMFLNQINGSSNLYIEIFTETEINKFLNFIKEL